MLAAITNQTATALRQVAQTVFRNNLPGATWPEIVAASNAYVKLVAQRTWTTSVNTMTVRESPEFQMVVADFVERKGQGGGDTILGINKKWIMYGALALGAFYFFGKKRA